MNAATADRLQLSVYVVTHRRIHYLIRCVQSVLGALPKQAELVVIVNGDDALTEKWLEENPHPSLRWLKREKRDRNITRNEAWVICRGKLIHFLDDDAEVPASIYEKALEEFANVPQLALLGGPNLTPPDSTEFEKLSGELLASPITCPLVWRRYRRVPYQSDQTLEHSLIGCNLFVNKNLLPESVRFEAQLVSNEENLLASQCRDYRLVASISENVFVYHHRRKTFLRLAVQIFSYGRGRGQQFLRQPLRCHPAFLLPGLAVVLFPLLSMKAMIGFLLMEMSILFFGNLFYSSYIRRKLSRALAAPFLSLLIHVAYGAGMVTSLVLSFTRTLVSACQRSPNQRARQEEHLAILNQFKVWTEENKSKVHGI